MPIESGSREGFLIDVLRSLAGRMIILRDEIITLQRDTVGREGMSKRTGRRHVK
jgi:hypothetical protein